MIRGKRKIFTVVAAGAMSAGLLFSMTPVANAAPSTAKSSESKHSKQTSHGKKGGNNTGNKSGHTGSKNGNNSGATDGNNTPKPATTQLATKGNGKYDFAAKSSAEQEPTTPCNGRRFRGPLNMLLSPTKESLVQHP